MLEKRSFSLSGHRTSVALEAEFWARLEALADARRISLSGLVTEIDSSRPAARGLASALRIYALGA